MDMKKIGSFLKALRKEKGLTQEQLAEKLGVAGRTVSRWETASNMPDLIILIQLAELYDVEIGEILDGERKEKFMDKELKETLTKVANYSEADKIRRAKINNVSFLITLFTCAISLLIQFVYLRNLQAIIGEYITLMIGATACVIMTVKNGLWYASPSIKKNVKYDLIISIVMSVIFTFVCSTAIYTETGDTVKTVVFAVIFFTANSVFGFAVLRIIAKMSKKNKHE